MVAAFKGIDGLRLVGVEGNPSLFEIVGNRLRQRCRRWPAVRRICGDALPVGNPAGMTAVPGKGGTGGFYACDGYSSRYGSRSRS